MNNPTPSPSTPSNVPYVTTKTDSTSETGPGARGDHYSSMVSKPSPDETFADYLDSIAQRMDVEFDRLNDIVPNCIDHPFETYCPVCELGAMSLEIKCKAEEWKARSAAKVEKDGSE